MAVLPKEISPEPRILATIEIRFDLLPDITNFVLLLVSNFSNLLPKVSGRRIPPHLALLPNARFAGEFVFSNDEFNLSVGRFSLSLENAKEYPKWDQFYSMLQKCLNIFFELKVTHKINRVGVRYGNVFSVFEAQSILKHNSLLSSTQYTEQLISLATNLKKDDLEIVLQIASNAAVAQNDKMVNGSLIDIDISKSNLVEYNLDTILKLIDKLHTEVKILLFENLLNEEYLKTLKIKY